MVGPYIPVTESEIIKPWPMGGFLLTDQWNDRAAGGEAKANIERQHVSPEMPKELGKGQRPEKGNDPIIKVPKGPEGPEGDDDSVIKISQELK